MYFYGRKIIYNKDIERIIYLKSTVKSRGQKLCIGQNGVYYTDERLGLNIQKIDININESPFYTNVCLEL